MITLPETPHILVVDDEPDVLAVTRLSLRGMRFRGKAVELAAAATGREAVAHLRQRPDTAVILLDVVMETLTDGLDACRAIREELGNRFVRILLRTGQPGVAPERQAIDENDIDGYLPKAELTETRLYAAVRTALKAYEELIELERYRELLKFVNDSATALRAFEPLEVTLERILVAALTIADSSLAVLDLETVSERGDPRRCSLHLSSVPDPRRAEEQARAVAALVAHDLAGRPMLEAGPFRDGFLVPLVIHRDLGQGWIYLEGGRIDPIARQELPLLAAHAANAIYAVVAQAMLAAREGPFYDELGV